MQSNLQPNITKEQYAENVLAASMMSQTMTCCAERKYLDSISKDESLIEIVGSDLSQSIYKHISWLRLKQVGRPINETLPSCFGYIQKILLSCAIPDTQLTFLVVGNGKTNDIYLGLRNDGSDNKPMSSSVSALNNFAKVCWPGLQFEQFNEENESLKQHFNTKYNSIQAITGIPTLAGKEDAMATVEHLIGGLRGQKYAYLVTASPVSNDRLDLLLNQCREMGGQIESVKSINISQSVQEGSSVAHTEGHSKFESWSHSEGESHKDYKKGLGAAMLGAGVYMAAGLFFPPAMAILPGLEHAMGGALMSNNPLATFLGLSGISGMNVLSGFVPQRSSTDAHNTGKSQQISDTTTYSKSMTEGLSKTLVNKHAEAAANKLKTYENRFEAAKAIGAWNVSCLLFTEQENLSSSLQLKSILSGFDSTLEPIRIHDVSSVVEHKGTAKTPKLLVKFKNGSLFHHPFGDDFSTLQTLLTTKELAALVNFPLHSVPGVSVVECPPEFRLDIPFERNENSVTLGNLLHRGKETDIKASFDINTLVRHSLVCGSNGSGKTNSVLGILNEVQNHDKNFMVVEPAKTEYVDWAISFNEQLKIDQKEGKRLNETPIVIYMPGRKHYWHTNAKGENEKFILGDILKINPFEPVALDGEEPNVQSHLDRIKSIFSLAFPMEDILPTVMETLLTDVYTNGELWLNRKTEDSIPEKFPTLSLLQCRAKNVIASLGYEQRVTANITAAINLRLSNLLSGWKRDLFNNEVLGGYKKLSKTEIAQGVKRPTWDDFFNRRVVINLSGIADDNDRVFVMGLLLLYLYEYRVATSERPGFSFNDETLKHLMVIEEAHRVMSKSYDPCSPQYKCGALFSQILSEIRAYGQGIMVIDQIPSRLIEDAIKNTNMKIIHRLIAADDIDCVSNSMGVNNEQKSIFPKLSVGQAVVAGLNASMHESIGGEDVYWVKIRKNK